MSVLFDWKCPEHGVFESTHAICPNFGCTSEGVVKTFLKAPGGRSDATRRFDAGIRKSAESMGLSNFRSAAPGDAAHGGVEGKKLLWGNEVQKVFPGQTMDTMSQTAAAGAKFAKKDGTTEVVPSGMRLAAQAGITQRAVPRAERTVARSDVKGGS